MKKILPTTFNDLNVEDSEIDINSRKVSSIRSCCTATVYGDEYEKLGFGFLQMKELRQSIKKQVNTNVLPLEKWLEDWLEKTLAETRLRSARIFSAEAVQLNVALRSENSESFARQKFLADNGVVSDFISLKTLEVDNSGDSSAIKPKMNRKRSQRSDFKLHDLEITSSKKVKQVSSGAKNKKNQNS